MHAGRATVVARAGEMQLIETLLQQHQTLYEAAAALPRVTELRGRGVAVVAQFGGEPWVVRHYRRGGSVMKVLDDRYARFGSPRVMTELRASEAARARGIATPQIKAGAWYDAGIFRRSDMASAYIPESHDLAAILFSNAGDPAAAVAATVTLLRSLVRGGLLHRDLNLKNILVATGRAYVLDLDRCAVLDKLSELQISSMRSRFFRSLEKWERLSRKTVDGSTKRELRSGFDV